MPDISQLGASGAVVIVVIFFLKYLREENAKNNIALDKLTKATIQNTAATKSADTYLRQRNGRDIEKHQELLVATKAIPDTLKQIADDQATAIIKAVTVKEQHVEHAHVEHQTVQNKE